MWFCYILKCSDNSFYTGITNDLDNRLEKHNTGKGAKYTRSRGPVELVYQEPHETIQTAMKREVQIKRLPKKKKEELIQQKGEI